MADNQSQQSHHQRLLETANKFEEELKQLSGDTPEVQQLQADFARLKAQISEPEPHVGSVQEAWETLRASAHETAEAVENRIIKDSITLAELGRIVGLL
jgi:septal ring factor EnvC (AmiA/AmiB activator)